MTPAKKNPEEKNTGEQRKQDASSVRDVLASRMQSGEGIGSSGGGGNFSVPKADEGSLKKEIRLFGPNIRDMAMFCRQLATLLDVGIPLLRSLKILAERTQHPKLKQVVGQVAAKVEEGQTLSSALAEHPKIFSNLFVSVAKVGEVGGILDSSLKRLAEILEKKSEIKSKVTSALMYPAVSLLVCIGVVIVILAFAIPKFVEVYNSVDAQLPGITKTIISLSNFVRNYPIIYIPLIVIAIVLLVIFLKTPGGKRLFDLFKLRMIVLGPITTKVNVARFTRTLGNLLQAGIPLLEGIRICAKTSENDIVVDTLEKVYSAVEKGGKMEQPLRDGNIFPPLVVDMISIGDEAGALDTMLIKVADAYDSEVDSTLKGLTSIIEPVLIVFMGFVVLFVALSLLLPYFNLVKVVE